MVTQVEIARRVRLDVSSVNKILNRRVGPVWRKETVRKVFRVARKMGYDFGNLRHTHRRGHDRKTVTLSAELVIYRNDGSIHDRGSATIRDLSRSGARISDLKLPQDSLPIPPFSVGIRKLGKSKDEIEIRGRIVRLHASGAASVGLEFEKDDPALGRTVRKVARV